MINNKNFLRLAEILIVVSLFISGFILFAYERRQNNPDYQKSWTAFYFANPEELGEGVTIENHLGTETLFRICVVPDSNDLIEPTDLNCDLESVFSLREENLSAGASKNWRFPVPEKPGKYWVAAEYKDKDNVLKNKDLSFQIK
ncbi:MAG: hypothetical protein FJZ04_03025 [Candidatus Moranbacteria bacterium]|nr:hypothetical protein [Candidatus Moranbacteria bacterium]